MYLCNLMAPPAGGLEFVCIFAECFLCVFEFRV